MSTGTWLTEKRLRAHALLLGLTMWSIYAWMLATPTLRDRYGNLKGTDFLHFYTLGCVAREHRGSDLYATNAQAAIATKRVPDAAGIRYLPLYPPQVSILFAPFSRLSYGWALAAWWILSALIYAACCHAVWLLCPALRVQRTTILLAAIAFPPFFHLIAWGQTSALALICFTAMFVFLQKRREFLVGIALGCLIVKPQLALAAAVVFIAIGSWRILIGAALSATAQLALGILYYGIQPLQHWFETLWRIRSVLPLLEPRPYQTHCLRTFWTMLIPWPSAAFTLYAISAIVILAVTIAVWRRTATPLSLRYSMLLLSTVLVSPHLTVYDLVVLAPVLLLTADWLVQQPVTPPTRHMASLLYLIYALPLFGPLARWTHLQLSVIAMTALMYLIYREASNRNLSASGKRLAHADS